MVLFLRPTESPVVFLQQLGRGLRRSAGKKYLTVLDFIGNYEKAGNVRRFLTGNAGSAAMSYRPSDREGIPEDYARKRVSAQKGEDFFRSHCDYILENDEGDTPETFRLRARALFAGLLNAK